MGREIRRVPKDWQHPMEVCPHSPWTGGCSEAKDGPVSRKAANKFVKNSYVPSMVLGPSGIKIGIHMYEDD